MSDLEPVPGSAAFARGEADLAVATQELRAVTSSRVVEIADRVLARTLAAPRPSRPVRARPPHTYLRVSSIAVTAVLREHLDRNLVAAAVGRVRLDVNGDDELTGLAVELYVQYGTDVLAVGDRTRELAREALATVLGPDETGDLTVSTSHVHVSDVTVGDPHLVDPSDEIR